MRTIIPILCLATACSTTEQTGDNTPAPDAAVSACEITVHQRYEPGISDELESFPDDVMTVLDETSPTGLRIAPRPETAAWLQDLPDVIKGAATHLDGLTGFGANSDIFLRFDGPVDIEINESFAKEHGPVRLYAMHDDGLEAIAFRLYVSEDKQLLRAQAARPLSLGVRHLLVVGSDLKGTDGGCVTPSVTLRSFMTGEDTPEELAHIVDGYNAYFAATGLGPVDIAAATLFTVHRDVDPLIELARSVDTERFEWLAVPECERGGTLTHCEGRFIGRDVRAELGHDVEPGPEVWQHEVSIWLPDDVDGPRPVILFAHGLNADRGSGARYARRFARSGFAVVAMDAAHHGAHPLASPDSALPALDFLGLSIVNLEIDAQSLRANIEQTAIDRLMLLKLLASAPDIDGDGEPDLRPEKVGYYGESLGGMLGSQLVALSSDLDAAVFAIAGGRLLDFATGTGQVEAFKPVLIDLFGSEARFERLLPVAQTIVDAADPATWAPHVMGDRFVERASPPHILFPVAIHDDTVPPSTGKALARALAAPHVGPVLDTVQNLEQQSAPVSANHEDGRSSIAFFQYDRISDGDAVIEATHGNLPLSAECFLQTERFFNTWLSADAPTVIDPYAELETPALPLD